ncbi:MAG TPA: hypothetical protein VLB74_00690, partial [Flavobacterium sp.]|uniref:hypothetical protein n=1 Tax=Flavobacterium sp. TaxID=239 RepID=UPI002C9924FD
MKKITICLLVNLFFVSISMFSQNEFLDQTFGTNGMISQNYTTDTGSGLESDFKEIILQEDGSFITASNFHLHGADPRYIINRYNKYGILDQSFGINGFVTSSLQNNIGDVELQSSGKIVGFAKEGYFFTPGSYLFRYTSDGIIDTSFGTNGIIADPENNIQSLSVQSDDNILVVKTPGNERAIAGYTLVRYKPDGALDGDFGSNGAVDFSLPLGNITLHEVVSLKNGKILISGVFGLPDPNDYRRDIFFIRLNNDGSLDMSFGEGGLKVFDFDEVDDTLNVLELSNGKMVFSASSYGLLPGSTVVNRLIRLNEDGNLDGAFHLDGIKIIDYPILGLQSLKELPDGKLIAAGTYETSENPTPENNQEPAAIVIARYDTNGDSDENFGNSGYITTTLNFNRAINGKITIQSDGKILAGTTFCEAWFSCHPHTVIFRYNPDERLANAEFGENNAFMIYPNPFRETVTIDFTLNQPEVLSMDLYSYDGRKVTT